MNFQEIEKQNKKNNFLRFGLFFFIIIIILAAGIGFGRLIYGYFLWQKTENICSRAIIEKPADYSFLKPFRNWRIENLEIEANAVILMEIAGDNSKILFGKNDTKSLPIASLTKIFSAYIAGKNHSKDFEIEFSRKAIETEGEIGFFRTEEKFYLNDLLYSVLMESSNDATYALAEKTMGDTFVPSMNNLAKELGLEKTKFVDAIGFDPDYQGQKFNQSSARDIAYFLKYLILNEDKNPHIEKIFEITRAQEFDLYNSGGVFHHQIKNTNKLIEDLSEDLIAGKTGTSPMAGQCFILVLRNPRHKDSYIATVVLGSKNRFNETKKILEWFKEAFIW